MKWRFDAINKCLYKGKRKVKKKDLDSFAKFSIWRAENNEGINHLFVEETDDLPRLAVIRFHIDEHFGPEYAKANSGRISMLQEDLFTATKEYKAYPSKDNLEKLVALEKIYSSLSKKDEKERPFNINFSQMFPDDFWSGHENPIPPENPRTKEQLKEAEIFGAQYSV